jgi:hypothetical protein
MAEPVARLATAEEIARKEDIMRLMFIKHAKEWDKAIPAKKVIDRLQANRKEIA